MSGGGEGGTNFSGLLLGKSKIIQKQSYQRVPSEFPEDPRNANFHMDVHALGSVWSDFQCFEFYKNFRS